MSPAPRSSAAGAAVSAVELLAAGSSSGDLWRHVVVQLLDDYTSVLQREGTDAAAQMLCDRPELTGDARVDAALAALAEHLARRDGWPVPAWATEPDRETREWWFVTELRAFHPRALVESPLSFRKRGVFITRDALERV